MAGSPHNRGFVWLGKSAEFPKNTMATGDQRKALAALWGLHVEAVHPFSRHLNDLPAFTEVLCIAPEDQNFDFTTLSQIFSKVQTHVCSEQHCIRKKKGFKERSCRFYFPRGMNNTPRFSKDMNPQYYTFAAKKKTTSG